MADNSVAIKPSKSNPPPYADNIALKTISIIAPCIAVLAVALRVVARRIKKVKLWIDDYLLIPALLFIIAEAVTNELGALGGKQGSDAPYLLYLYGPKGLLNIRHYGEKLLRPSLVFWVQVLFFTKLSVIFLYYRIFQVHSRLFRSAIWAVGLSLIAWWIASTLLVILQCVPVVSPWSHTHQTCVNQWEMYEAIGISNLLTDAIVLIFPIPVIWNMQAPLARRLTILSMFLLGWLSAVSGIIRLVYQAHYYIAAGNGAQNLIAKIAKPTYWQMIEAFVTILAACLPTYRPLVTRMTGSKAYYSLRQMLYGTRGSSRRSEGHSKSDHTSHPSKPRSGSSRFAPRKMPDEENIVLREMFSKGSFV